MNIAQGGQPLDYVGFLSLGRSTAESIDRRRPNRGTLPPGSSSRHRANLHDISGSVDPSSDTTDSLQINAVGRLPGSTMSKDIWNSLSDAAKST